MRFSIRPRELTAAIKAIQKTGETITRVSISFDGEIKVYARTPGRKATTAAFDEWMRQRAIRRIAKYGATH